jgi:hypothetical protein
VDLSEQLEAKEGGSKKIRGFKSKNSSSNESHAVQGTLVLDEGPDLTQPEKPVEAKNNHKKGPNENSHQGQNKNEKSNRNHNNRQDRSNKNDKSKR